MAHNPSPHLYQLHLKAAQRPILDCLGQGQPAQEVPQVVGQNEKLEPNLIGIKPVAGKPGPVQGILALLNPLPRRPTAIVEVHYTLSFGGEVGSPPVGGYGYMFLSLTAKALLAWQVFAGTLNSPVLMP